MLEGDELVVSLRLGPGARLAVRSVAAQLVHPCPGGGWGALTIDAVLDTRASLCWRPEPVVVAGGGRLRARTTVDCADDAALWWTDELVLGRSGESRESVELDTSVRIDVAGRPVWRDGLSSAPGWTGPAVLGTARYVGSRLRAGGAADGATTPATTAAGAPGEGTVAPGADPEPYDSGWVPLVAGGLLRRVLATDPAAGRTALGCA